MKNFKDNKIDSNQVNGVQMRNTNIDIKQIFESRYIIYTIFLIFIFFMILAIFYNAYNYNYFRDPPFYFTLRPENSLEQSIYTWEEYNLGANYLWGIQKAPLFLIFVLSRNVFDQSIFMFLFNFMILFVGFLGMFIFSKIFVFSELGIKQRNGFALISGFLFAFNPFTAITTIAGIFLLIPYIFIPWFIILGYKSLSSDKWLIIYVLLFSFVVSSFFNPATVIIASITNIILLIFFSMRDKLSYKIFIKKILLFGIIFVFLTSYWNLPLILSSLIKSPFDLELDREMFHALNSNIFEVFKLTNQWQIYENNKGFYMFAFSEFFKNGAYILFLFPILSLISLMFITKLSKHQKRLTIFIFIFLVFGLILAQGYHTESHIRDTYIYLMEKGYFGFFRDNYKFDAIIAFSYSLLIPLSLLSIGNLKAKTKNYLLYSTHFLLFILIIFSSYPFWGGKLFDRYYDEIPSSVTNVSRELNNVTIDGRILILPTSHMPTYNWIHPTIKKPIWYATLDAPVINRYGGDFSPNPVTRIFLEDIYSELLTYYPDDILSFLRVKKIIIDKNVDTNFFGKVRPTKNINDINNWLRQSEQVKLEKSYTNVSVYSFKGDVTPLFFGENITENGYLPNKYTSQRGIIFENNISSCWSQVDKNDSSHSKIRDDAIQMSFILNQKGSTCIVHKKFAKSIEVSKLSTFLMNIEYESGNKSWYESGNKSWYESGNKAWYESGNKAWYESGNKAWYESGNKAWYESGNKAWYESGNKEEYDIAPVILLKSVDGKWTEPITIGTIDNSGQTKINYTFSSSFFNNRNMDRIKELQIGIYAKGTDGFVYPLIGDIIFSDIYFIGKEKYDFKLPSRNVHMNYTKVNPTLYKINTNVTKPFMLYFAESYDHLWTAKIVKIEGKDIESNFIHPIPLYNAINGFQINQTGNLDIMVEYESQRWFYIGSIISMITLIICISYLIYDWRKTRVEHI